MKTIIVIILILISLILIVPLILMLLWNALMPGIFGIVKINIWQSLGLWILSWILFRNIPSSSKQK
jgi:positive regulator of sigma E activity